MRRILSCGLIIILVLSGCGQVSSSNQEINIYTSRDYEVDKQIMLDFTEATNIKVNVVELDNEELVTKVIAEKNNPVADVVIVNGAQYIADLNQEGILNPIDSKVIDKNVDPQFIGDNYVGLTYRARAVCYNPNTIDASNLNTYSDLGLPEYKDKVLVRSSTNSYNQALIMNMIQNQGYDQTLEFAKNLTANMAQEPKGGDRDQIKSIYANQGDIAITNSYYYAQMLNSSDEAEVQAAQSCELKFLDDTHINMTWLGVTTSGSENKNVNELIKFMTSKDVQSMYALENGEFPVNTTADFGYFTQYKGFKYQPIDFATLGENKVQAQEIFNISGWK